MRKAIAPGEWGGPGIDGALAPGTLWGDGNALIGMGRGFHRPFPLSLSEWNSADWYVSMLSKFTTIAEKDG